MSRLIDADALQEHFEKVKKESASLVDIAHILGFQSVIDAQPTAFDIEKVVEEIEIDRQVDFNYHIRTDYRSLINDIYDKTVQKVRKGGVNE